jgi:putative transposase
MANGYLNGPGSAQLRRGRHSESGRIYLVTFTTRHRARLFDDTARARAACCALTDPRTWVHSRLLAWVLMPDHWHGVIEVGEGEPLSQLVCRLKATSARRVRMECDSPPVWAVGFHDRALRHEDDLRAMARYVVLNPVRAGLASSVLAYPYWDAVWIEGSTS